MRKYLNGELNYKLWIILIEGVFLLVLSPTVYRLNPNNLHPIFYFCVGGGLVGIIYVSLRFYYNKTQKIEVDKN